MQGCWRIRSLDGERAVDDDDFDGNGVGNGAHARIPFLCCHGSSSCLCSGRGCPFIEFFFSGPSGILVIDHNYFDD